MKFEELKPNFLSMGSQERLIFMFEYAEKRNKDIEMLLVNVTQKKKGVKKGKGKMVSVTGEQLALLKALGLV
jgi:hypothetical protein